MLVTLVAATVPLPAVGALSRIAIGALSCVIAAGTLSTAHAQTTYTPDFDPEQYAHSADPNAISLLDGARPLGKREYGLGLAFHLGGAPLSACVRDFNTGGCLDEGGGNLITHRLTSHLVGALGFGRFDLRAALPIVLDQGTDFAAEPGMSQLSSSGFGDLRLGGRYRIARAREFAFAAAMALTLPLNGGANFIGNPGVTLHPRLIADWRRGKLAAVASFGYLWRQDSAQLANLYVDDELTWTLGGQYTINSKLSAGLAMFGRIGILSQPNPAKDVNPSPTGEERPAEFLLTGRYWLDNHIALEGGAGSALSSGYGAANFRVVFGMRWVQRNDRFEQPPRVPSMEVVMLLPDKDGNVGAIEVDDGDTKTTLDTAYQATELSGTSSIHTVQRSAKAVPAFVRMLARVLPPPDRDMDDIADANDACPDRAGTPSTDPLRNGCPATSEKVVVIPDENGHVGAVEIDDGKTTTLLDHAYSSAEVGSSGGARKVSPAPASVIKKTMQVVVSLPAADSDGDGVVDTRDVCPDRAGAASADPLSNGCPPSTERVVVLPDADGHVGAVEIDNGKKKVLVDKPYASADVGTDASLTVAPPTSAPRPLVRVIANIAAILPPADDDGDGIADGADACPKRKGVKSANPLRNGCPTATETVMVLPNEDGTVGSLVVDDGTNKVVLDKPYANSEVHPDGKVHPAPPRLPALVTQSITGIAAVLPRADEDGDGIVDANDACKHRPGKTNVNPKLNGCPVTQEKVVVLPDADGHVGAVEIGTGSHKVLLDKAYAAAEIGADGKAVAVRTRAVDVQTEFRETLSARPDYSGARIVIYFNNRAQPTYSVKDQVDDLVVDLIGRKGYTITVVGHTDQTGSARANMRLGRRRAQKVADQLVRQGVPRRNIKVISKGQTQPAVRVSDPSIPALKNRRVEIFVKY